tara:strand:+ start:5229 stop:7289 length:2061 start_codon:yes stop_codon:yes gene_type:complete
MGTSLAGQKISAKYQYLLKTAEAAFSTSLTNIEDGAGNASDLSVATNKVKVGTALGINQSAPTYKLDISGTTSAVRVDNGTNASFLVGKGNTYGFCAGDCNPATTVGGGSAGSTTAQANKNYIAIDPTFASSAGRVTIMNGASSGTGAIGIGADATATGFIEFGASNKIFKFTAKTATQSFYVYGNGESQLSIDSTNKRVGLGEDVTNPAHTVEIRETGSAKANTDILAITNKTNAADMDGTEGSILFNQWYYDASTPAVADAGRISVGTETDWTSSGSTQDSYMSLETALDGTVAEKVRITSAGYVGINAAVPTSHLHVNGNIYASGSITAAKAIVERTRYQLEEYFDRKPQLNATSTIDPDANDATALAAFVKANRHFELATGANAADANVIYDGDKACVQLQTAGSLNTDSMIIQPHTDYLTSQYAGAQTAWTGMLWGTEDQVSWECSITTDSTITDCMYWAGLKLTNTNVYTTNNDQAYFFYDSSKTILSHAGTATTWHFVYSNNGTHYVTNLGVVVSTDATYHFKIDINSERETSVYINGDQYGLTTISGVGATGVLVDGGGSSVSLSNGSSHVLTVDGTDATTKIVVGDVIVDDGSSQVYGTVTAVTATSVTITASDTVSLPDNTNIHINGRAAVSSTTDGSALKDNTNLIPYIGILKHTNSTARALRVSYQKISRVIGT